MKVSFEKQFYIISKFIFIYRYYSNNTTHSNGKSEQDFDRRVRSHFQRKNLCGWSWSGIREVRATG